MHRSMDRQLEMELDGRSPPSQEEAAGPGILQLLPYDLIDVIIERLPLSDFIRFGAVCVEWQHVQKEYRRRFSLYPPPPRLHSLPWFIAQFPLIRLETATSCMSPFESSSRSYSIETPNLSADMTSSTCNYSSSMLPNSRRRRLLVPFLVGPFGSSHGWLVVAQLVRLNFDFHEELFFLVNPVSGKTFKLPKTPPIATSSSINCRRICAVLSPPPYYVLFRIRARQHLLYLFRHNDNAWTVINLTNNQLLLKPEATTTVNGVLYYLSSSWELLAVNAYNPTTPTIEKIEMDMTHLPVQPQPANYEEYNYFPFLVESNGDILLVIRFYVNYNIQNTTGFAVLKANFKNKMWIKMETSLGGLGLGDRALFMDTYNTCSVSAVGVGNGIRGNCIYYLIRGYDLCWRVFDLNTGKADDAANCYISNPLFRHHFMILPSLC